jgi:hypothetical protein
MAVQLPAYTVNETRVNPTSSVWDSWGANFNFGDDGSYDDTSSKGGYATPVTPAQPLTQDQRLAKSIQDAIDRENAKRKAAGIRPISPILDKDLWAKIAETAQMGVFAADQPGTHKAGALEEAISALKQQPTTMPTTTTGSTGTTGSGSSWITPANLGGLAAIAGSIIASQDASKLAGKSASAGQTNIEELDALVRRMSQQNALESRALEDLLTPEVGQLRTKSNEAVLNSIGQSESDKNTEGLFTGMLNSPVTAARTPLLEAAIQKAKEDLALGGALSKGTQNEVTRAALSKAGTITPGGLGLGRDITARDLGLMSRQVEQQRLENASRLGGQELEMGQFRTGTDFNNKTSILNVAQLLNSLNSNRFAKDLSAAQYAQSIRQPVVGLDPASAANVFTGNATNASAAYANDANIKGQTSQNYLNLAGQLGGYALLGYNNSGTSGNNAGTGAKKLYG